MVMVLMVIRNAKINEKKKKSILKDQDKKGKNNVFPCSHNLKISALLDLLEITNAKFHFIMKDQ